MLNVTLVGGQQLVARLQSMPDKLRRALKIKITTLANELRNMIINDKLSGQVLNVRTGALRRSIVFPVVTESQQAVFAKVFSSGDVKYAAIHEFGGLTGKNHNIVMPERSYMRSSLKDMQDKITQGLREAVVEGTKL